MFFLILGIDQDVAIEDNNKLVQLRHEYEDHQVHKMCRSIGESKRYNQILIQPVPGRESRLTNIFWTDLDLMIIQTKIDLGKDSCTNKLIKENVDAGQWILVLDRDDIQRPVVNA
jgi:dynactin complex subunit